MRKPRGPCTNSSFGSRIGGDHVAVVVVHGPITLKVDPEGGGGRMDGEDGGEGGIDGCNVDVEWRSAGDGYP